MDVTCPRCRETGSVKRMNIKGVCHYCREEGVTPANDVETARHHHEMHGDMDGETCLLDQCVLHHPLTERS